jgi:hypothetical protein
VNRLGHAIATTYLITALVGGVVMVFLSPPFQAPDEPNHFFRAQALSEGYLVARSQPGKIGALMRAVSGMYLIANPAPGIDPAAQRAWMEAHPLRFVEIVWSTFLVYWSPILHSAVGMLGWLDTALAPRYVKLFHGALIVSGVVAGTRAARAGWAERGLADQFVWEKKDICFVIAAGNDGTDS